MDPPTEFDLFLGAKHDRFEIQHPHDPDKIIRGIEYNVEDKLRSACDKYRSLTKMTGPLKPADTPFVVDTDLGIAAPAHLGSWIECPWCKGRFAEHTFGRGIANKYHNQTSCMYDRDQGGNPDDLNKGKLADDASSVVMQLLFAARVGRFDLLRAIGRLASKVSCWTVSCDKQLHKLMRYVSGSLHLRQMGYTADNAKGVSVTLYCDADFAGCKETMRSTTGMHLSLSGKSTCWPILAMSKKQTATSHSTPEAEIVSCAQALRVKGLPFLHVWEAIIGKPAVCEVMEDNDAMIRVAKTGKNPTMRHIGRTHCVSISWLQEQVSGKYTRMHYCPTDRQCADIYTKTFEDKFKWIHARILINVVAKDELTWIEILELHDVERILADDPTLKKGKKKMDGLDEAMAAPIRDVWGVVGYGEDNSVEEGTAKGGPSSDEEQPRGERVMDNARICDVQDRGANLADNTAKGGLSDESPYEDKRNPFERIDDEDDEYLVKQVLRSNFFEHDVSDVTAKGGTQSTSDKCGKVEVDESTTDIEATAKGGASDLADRIVKDELSDERRMSGEDGSSDLIYDVKAQFGIMEELAHDFNEPFFTCPNKTVQQGADGSTVTHNEGKVISEERLSSERVERDDGYVEIPGPGKGWQLTECDTEIILAALECVAWDSQVRSIINGQGRCVGATANYSGHMLHLPKDRTEHASVRIINMLLRKYVGNHFVWGALQLNHNSVSKPHRDKGNAGYSLILLAGVYTGGSFNCYEEGLRTPPGASGLIVMTDGTKEHFSEPFQGERYSIVAFRHSRMVDATPNDLAQLGSVGFPLEAIYATCAAQETPEISPARKESGKQSEEDSMSLLTVTVIFDERDKPPSGLTLNLGAGDSGDPLKKRLKYARSVLMHVLLPSIDERWYTNNTVGKATLRNSMACLRLKLQSLNEKVKVIMIEGRLANPIWKVAHVRNQMSQLGLESVYVDGCSLMTQAKITPKNAIKICTNKPDIIRGLIGRCPESHEHPIDDTGLYFPLHTYSGFAEISNTILRACNMTESPSAAILCAKDTRVHDAIRGSP